MREGLRSQRRFEKQESGEREVQTGGGVAKREFYHFFDPRGLDFIVDLRKGERSNDQGLVGREILRKQLVDAGWIIGYIFTDGNKYNQEVYITLDGSRAFTSIILAYNRLKKHYKDGNGEGRFYGQGFQLRPVPEMTINMSMNKESKSEEAGHESNKRKRTMLSWMIDLGTIQENAMVQYMKHQRKIAVTKGKITRDGIQCDCCNKIVSITEFGAHSGNTLSNPLKKIYIEGGISLFQCMLKSWDKMDKSKRQCFRAIDIMGDDPNDDLCLVCGDGGCLIHCGSCPSVFHKRCLDTKMLRSGDRHCIYCQCKFCGLFGKRSNIIETTRDEFMGVLTEAIFFQCRSCWQIYHKSCLEVNTVNLKDPFLCGNRSCQELSEKLGMLLGFKHEMEDGFSWTLIRWSNVDSNASQIKSQMVECNSKLAIALSIFNECFKPSIDGRTKINLIHSMIYSCGSNFARVDCKGFVTAILERGDEMICVATIRIHGNQLAEMPFVATREMYRQQGMCRRLLNAIEIALSFLNVELLVIPAATSTVKIWSSSFGFKSLESTTKKAMKNKNLLHFSSSVVLQKKIPKYNFSDKSPIFTQDYSFKKKKVHKEANTKVSFEDSIVEVRKRKTLSKWRKKHKELLRKVGYRA